MIDILIPVLGRPQNASPLVENIRDVTEVPHTITFLCTDGDEKQTVACEETGARTIVMTFPAGAADYAKKINRGCELTENEWLFNGADDLTFTPGWDTQALTAAGDTYDVIATNDMANGSVKRGLFGTHNLIRRRYVTDGKVLHEGYDHNFVDRELCGWAQKHEVYTAARHSIVKHHHPLFNRAIVEDPTYKKSLRHFHRDRNLFLSRAHLWDYHGLSDQERKLAA